uniref:KOW domain-containing protein n=1 Tax=Rhabditophanes sp. KR3021 TaxID=114890 RepID=A0AC35TIJ6_9BILA
MFRTGVLNAIKKNYLDLDFARNLPKEYVDRMKRTVPKKIYSNRLGADDIIRWELPPEDYVPSTTRPWSQAVISNNMKRAQRYHSNLINPKFFRNRRSPYNPELPKEEWTIYRGDYVMVMVGKDKNRTGRVIRINRETNSVFVEGLHTIMEPEIAEAKKLGLPEMQRWKEQALDVSKGQVKLVNPSDEEPTDVKWELSEDGSEYVRISTTGHVIPLPAEAHVTYEYVTKENYMEAEKDTKPGDALKRTYMPQLCSFEDEIMESMKIKEDRERQPSFWY